MSQSLFYWIIYSYQSIFRKTKYFRQRCLNPYFTGLSILMLGFHIPITTIRDGLNPYFTGLSILISRKQKRNHGSRGRSQSLFYWIIYSYMGLEVWGGRLQRLSQSLFYWIIYSYNDSFETKRSDLEGLNPYFTGLSILILRILHIVQYFSRFINAYFKCISIV